MTPEFIKNIDWELLREQKDWLVNGDYCKESLGLINLIDAIQDYAVDELGIDEDIVFNNIND